MRPRLTCLTQRTSDAFITHYITMKHNIMLRHLFSVSLHTGWHSKITALRALVHSLAHSIEYPGMCVSSTYHSLVFKFSKYPLNMSLSIVY